MYARLSVCLSVALSIVMITLFGASLIWNWTGKTADVQVSAKTEATEPIVASRNIWTGLVKLRVQEVDLNRLVSHVMPEAGAIEVVQDKVIIAQQDGRFAEMAFDGSIPPTIRELPTRIDTKSAEMAVFYEPQNLKKFEPARVTDLMLLANGTHMAATHVHWDDVGHCLNLRVSVIALVDLLARQESKDTAWVTVFDSKPCVQHFMSLGFGGRTAQVGPEKIIVTHGHGDVTDPEAEAFQRDYGKIFRVGLADKTVEVVSKGHRNPQGLLMDTRGRLWSTEHGPQGGDELNLIKQGSDYGWPYVTYGTEYGRTHWHYSRYQGRHTGYEKPVFAWLPSIGVSNLVEIRHFHARWDGDFLVASLRDKSLYRLRLEGERVIYAERIEIGERIRDIVQMPDGPILLWTDNAKVLRITAEGIDSDSDAVTRLPAKTRTAVLGCLVCHNLDRTLSDQARISLFSLQSKNTGSAAANLYSPAFRKFAEAHSSWDRELLDTFLNDPEALIPGTTMAGKGIPDGQTRAAVLDFLATLQ